MSYWTDREYEAEAQVILLNREDDSRRSLRKCVSDHINLFFTDVPPELTPQKSRLFHAVCKEAARP